VKELYISPKIIKFDDRGYNGASSYTDYNYGKQSFLSKVKCRHFNIALKLTKKYFHKVNVIDIGCADGPFIPSLSRYFNNVVGIEYDPKFVEQARKAVFNQHLENVSIIGNREKSFTDIKKELGESKYSIIFLMEVLEHVGNHYSTMYKDKLSFLKEASALVDDGIIVISVPKMTGFSFLFQAVGQVIFNLGNKKEILSLPVTSLLKCIFLSDTKDVEHLWRPYYTHMGFNHKKLEEVMRRDFEVIKSKSDWFQQVYIIKNKNIGV